MLYFAYGSNLHAKDLAAYCASKGRDVAWALGEPAWLPDFRPVFHYRSEVRQGGALDVVPSKGHVAAGALFTLSAEEAQLLDGKESAGVNYERKELVVATASGLRSAFTYVVCESMRRSYVAPTPEYLSIVERGYAHFGHDASALHDAARGLVPRPLGRLFVYGTLMHGECRAHLIPANAPTTARLHDHALYDLGEYPGMRVSRAASVKGEVDELGADGLAEVLTVLDEVEDFHGYPDLRCANPRSIYARTIVRVGGELAWTYLLLDASEGALIEGGDWRRRTRSSRF